MPKLLLPMFCGLGELVVERCEQGIIITSKEGRVLIPAAYALAVAAGILSVYGDSVPRPSNDR